MFPNDHPILVDPILDQDYNFCGSRGEHPHEHILHDVHLSSTLLYYLFTYDDAQEFKISMLYEDQNAN